MTRLKTVFHVHTDHSDDGNASVRDILTDARRLGVDAIAVTDHDTIEGARELAAVAGPELRVIVGAEISTADGHLIGLFLHEPIDSGLPVRRTAELIHRQGGLVVTPHPFNRIFGCSLNHAVFSLLDLIDVVEVSNAQNLSPLPNRRSDRFARECGFPAIVGADMHHRGHLDVCYQMLEPFNAPESFLAALRRANFVTGRQPLSYFARSAWVIARQSLGLGLPDGYGRNAVGSRRWPDRPAVASND